MAAKNKSNELKLTRVYDAPVKAVWEAWTDPKQIAQWWGPRGFTLTTHSKDLKPGGTWHYTMHGPDGTDYESTTVYHEVEKYSRLVYDHGGHKDSPPMFHVTVTFAEVKGKTKMEMTMRLPTAEAAEETRKFIKTAGGDATWDRLGEFLEKEAHGKEKFFINRTFHASLDLMYEMWTDPKHFAKWLPPTGFEMTFIKVEIKPGGQGFYRMDGPGGMKMFGCSNYLEMERPNRLVYTQQFCDEGGKVARHPMSPTWPETMMTTVTLTAEDAEHTRVTITWEPHNATREEIDTFIKARAGMTQGWSGSFEKLEGYLAKQG